MKREHPVTYRARMGNKWRIVLGPTPHFLIDDR